MTSQYVSCLQDTKQQAYELIYRMAPGQVSVVVSLLKIILDPVDRAIANAPFEDEEISEEEVKELLKRMDFIHCHIGVDYIPRDWIDYRRIIAQSLVYF